MDTATTPTAPAAPTPDTARDRLAIYGAGALGDLDLVALVIGASSPVDPRVVAAMAGGLHGLSTGDYQASAAVRGRIDATIELGRRLARLDLPYATTLRGPEDVARFARATWGDREAEGFFIIGMDARGRVRLVREVARGSVSHVDAHPREVFRPLVVAGLHSVIVVHNHPSGEPDPSQADIELTRRLADVGKLVGIPLRDHLIVTRVRSVSLANLGLVPGQ